jgi:predicted O-methyltransferase YrrM
MEFRELRALSYPLANLDELGFIEAITNSPEYAIARSYFIDYPPSSLLHNGHIARPFLYMLCRLVRPRWVLEIGTYQAGTTEVFARALWANGGGNIATVDPNNRDLIDCRLGDWDPRLRTLCHPIPANSMEFFSTAKSNRWRYDIIFVDGDHDFEAALFDIWSSASRMNPGGYMVIDNADQPGPREAARQFLRDNPLWTILGARSKEMMSGSSLVDLADGAMSVDQTGFWVLRAPQSFCVGQKLAFYPEEIIDDHIIEGLRLAPAPGSIIPKGNLRCKIYLRAHPYEARPGLFPLEYQIINVTTTDPAWSAKKFVDLMLPSPMDPLSKVDQIETYRISTEIFLTFEPDGQGDVGVLQLTEPPAALLRSGRTAHRPMQSAAVIGSPLNMDQGTIEELQAAGAEYEFGQADPEVGSRLDAALVRPARLVSFEE